VPALRHPPRGLPTESSGISRGPGGTLPDDERIEFSTPTERRRKRPPGIPRGSLRFQAPCIFDNSIPVHASWPVVQRKNPSLRQRRSVVRIHPGQYAHVAQWQSVRLICGRSVARFHPCAPSSSRLWAEHPHDTRMVRNPIPRYGGHTAEAGHRRATDAVDVSHHGCAGSTPALCTVTGRSLVRTAWATRRRMQRATPGSEAPLVRIFSPLK
jgi:hypothetical protein